METITLLFSIALIISIMSLILALINIIFLEDTICKDPYYFFPSHIYKRTTLNKFGVALDSLFLFVINFGYCIVMLLNWLCHVGRNGD